MLGRHAELLNSMPVEFIGGDNCNIKSKLIDRKKDSNITSFTAWGHGHSHTTSSIVSFLRLRDAEFYPRIILQRLCGDNSHTLNTVVKGLRNISFDCSFLTSFQYWGERMVYCIICIFLDSLSPVDILLHDTVSLSVPSLRHTQRNSIPNQPKMSFYSLRIENLSRAGPGSFA